MKVFVSTTSFAALDAAPLDLLKAAGLEVALNSLGRKLTKDEAKQLLRGFDGVIAGTETLDGEVLAALPGLRVISRCGTATENVDLVAAGKLGIRVANTPDAPTAAVAELTVALLLDCLRRVSAADRKIRQGKWEKPMGELLEGKTVGLVGFGRIGRSVARLLLAFGCRLLAYDPAGIKESAGVSAVSLPELIAASDIVTLHLPSQKGGALVDEAFLAKMKPGSYLINAARGDLVDEAALAATLKSGRLAGAGIDTFGREPYSGELTGLDNVVLTPHIGSYARQARIRMEVQAAENVIAGLKEGIKQ